MIPEIELDEKQAAAVQFFSEWYRDGEQLGYLAGQAGTGKTTVAKSLAGAIGAETVYAAYTGKAANVLRRYHGVPARTLHSLIYRPIGEASRKRINELKKEIKAAESDAAVVKLQRELQDERKRMRPGFEVNPDGPLVELLWGGSGLVICDEVSMVDEKLAKDLLSFGVKTLVLGDPNQLPPIGGAGYLIESEPDYLLTELHRHNAEQPVYQYAELVRTKGVEALTKRRDGASAVWPKAGVRDLYGGAAHKFDQVICWTNKTRHIFNTAIREELGLPEGLAAGDRLICLENNPDFDIFNGEQFTVRDVSGITTEGGDRRRVTLADADGRETRIPIWLPPFEGPQAEKEFSTDIAHFDRRKAGVFTYAYAITAHKAQGSQFERVLVVDETPQMSWLVKKGKHEGSFPAQWLYTAITRAKESVVVVR